MGRLCALLFTVVTAGLHRSDWAYLGGPTQAFRLNFGSALLLLTLCSLLAFTASSRFYNSTEGYNAEQLMQQSHALIRPKVSKKTLLSHQKFVLLLIRCVIFWWALVTVCFFWTTIIPSSTTTFGLRTANLTLAYSAVVSIIVVHLIPFVNMVVGERSVLMFAQVLTGIVFGMSIFFPSSQVFYFACATVFGMSYAVLPINSIAIAEKDFSDTEASRTVVASWLTDTLPIALITAGLLNGLLAQLLHGNMFRVLSLLGTMQLVALVALMPYPFSTAQRESNDSRDSRRSNHVHHNPTGRL